MSPNQYMSRYSKYDTHFKREQDYQTRNLPWAHEMNKGKIDVDVIVFFGSVVAFVVAVFFLYFY